MQKNNRYQSDYQAIFSDLDKLPAEKRAAAFELARTIAECRQDPVMFGEKLLGLKFHAKQKIWLWLTTKTQIDKAIELARVIGYPLPGNPDLLHSHNFLKNILRPGNRFGKTFVTAVKHVWYNFNKIGKSGSPKDIARAPYNTLNLSPHSMQVDALYNYIVAFFQETFVYEWPANSGQFVRNVCRIKEFLVDKLSIKREILFANNSKIKGAPTGDDQASSIQGTDYFYISYDEAPQSLHLREELPGKIMPRLIDSGGPLDLIGTPEVSKPSHQYYSRIVKSGLNLQDGWFTLLGSLDENEFINEEKKSKSLESIRTTDPEKYKQVRFGDFIASGGQLFPQPVIEKLWEGSPQDPQSGHEYLVSVDWGFSDNGDPTLIYVFDLLELFLDPEDFIRFFGPHRLPHARVVHRTKLEGPDPYVAVATAQRIWENYNAGHFLHDSTSMGGVMLKKMLRSSGIRNIHDFSSDEGLKDEMLFLTSRAMAYRWKDATIDKKFIKAHPDFGRVRSFIIPELEEQLGIYKRDDKKLEQDEVMAFGNGVWFIEKKLVKKRVPVFNLNILASDPADILKVPQAKGEDPAKEIKTRVLNINEKIIG